MFGNKEIFTIPVFAEIQNRTSEAIRLVNGLPDDTVRGPSLAGEVDKIVKRYDIRIPDLLPEQKKGKRRVGTGGGSVIDVTIPTTGDAVALRLQPGNSPIFPMPVSLTQNGVVVTLPDGDGLEKEINDFIARIQPAIALLKGEVASYMTGLRSAVERGVQERVASLKARADRDQKRSFPIE